MQKKPLRAFLFSGLVALALIGLWQSVFPPPSPVAFGATFSKPYAEQLGLDWRKTYIALLDDLGVRRLRIPVYWDALEPAPGEFVFEDIDWMVRQAAMRDTDVILVVGRKLPRWPECRVPSWAASLDEEEIRRRTIMMVAAVVGRYKDDPAIVAWQVENEPLFWWGVCPFPSRSALTAELAAVRALDDRPILMQNGGEFSLWLQSAAYGDRLGVSIYRTVWNKYYGFINRPIPVAAYRFRAALVGPLVDDVIITELQAEPWFPVPVIETPIDSQLSLMDPERLDDNVRFARRIGFSEAYFWGVEWWYWLAAQGHPEMWEAGKGYFRYAR